MTRKTILFFFVMLFTSLTYAQLASYDEVIEGNINTDKVLSSTKKYLLKGFVNINAPATLTIPAGTIIYGEKSSKATLIINRGAKINAVGTAQKPIIFTSQQPIGQRGAGDWGGIILAGNATINVPGGTATIEGGTGTIYGGGAAPNDDDNSGTLKYVRIEFPGIAFLPDNEINGLTMGGVGRGTTIHYVQVSYSGDDSFEWFGGTVNAKHLIAFKGVDDEFDTDFGFRGKIQFAFGLRDPNIADISGSNGFESDNDGTGTTNAPRTQPLFSNVTIIGPLTTPDFTNYNSNFKRGMHLRRSSLCSMYNSVVIGYPTGLFIQSSNSANGATADELQIKNSIIAGAKINSGISQNLTTDVAGFDISAWFNTVSFGNRTYNTSAEVGLVAPFNLLNPNPLPSANSPAASGASFGGKLQDQFFTATTFIGAFSPTDARWDAGWTNYDPQNTNYTLVSVKEDFNSAIPVTFALSQNYPNPFNPTTNIKFALPQAGNVKLTIYNTIGQEVAQLVNGYKEAGSYTLNWDGSNLSSGIYIYRLEAANIVITKKMTLLK